MRWDNPGVNRNHRHRWLKIYFDIYFQNKSSCQNIFVVTKSQRWSTGLCTIEFLIVNSCSWSWFFSFNFSSLTFALQLFALRLFFFKFSSSTFHFFEVASPKVKEVVQLAQVDMVFRYHLTETWYHKTVNYQKGGGQQAI